jgi:hydrogenase maturation protease
MAVQDLVRVIGCGNADAGDDAAGLLAVRAVAPRFEEWPEVEVLEVRDPLWISDLLEDIRGAVVVDGVRTGSGDRPPGEIVRWQGIGDLAVSTPASVSSHGVTVATAIGLAAAMGSTATVVFLGVEVGNTAVGTPPGLAVATSIDDLADRIEAEVVRLLLGGAASGARP